MSYNLLFTVELTLNFQLESYILFGLLNGPMHTTELASHPKLIPIDDKISKNIVFPVFFVFLI